MIYLTIAVGELLLYAIIQDAKRVIDGGRYSRLITHLIWLAVFIAWCVARY